MKTKRLSIAVLGMASLLLPAIVVAQTDPNASPATSPYAPTSPSMSPVNTQNGQAGGQVNQANSMRDSLGAPGETGQQMLDQQFVRSSAEDGIADVKLGELAIQKGGPAVKELAQKLVDDHTAINKDIDTVADSMGILLPKKMNNDDQKEYAKLNGLSGKSFDTEYVTYTVKAHFDELHSYHVEVAATMNADLSAEVVKGMGVMHDHIGLITDAAKAQGIALPARPVRPGSTPPTTASK